jgi:hypothetical protein
MTRARDPVLHILLDSDLRATRPCTCQRLGVTSCPICHGSGRVRAKSQQQLIRAYRDLRDAYLKLLLAARPD